MNKQPTSPIEHATQVLISMVHVDPAAVDEACGNHTIDRAMASSALRAVGIAVGKSPARMIVSEPGFALDDTAIRKFVGEATSGIKLAGGEGITGVLVMEHLAIDARIWVHRLGLPWPDLVWCLREGARGCWPDLSGGHSLDVMARRFCLPMNVDKRIPADLSVDMMTQQLHQRLTAMKVVTAREMAKLSPIEQEIALQTWRLRRLNTTIDVPALPKVRVALSASSVSARQRIIALLQASGTTAIAHSELAACLPLEQGTKITSINEAALLLLINRRLGVKLKTINEKLLSPEELASHPDIAVLVSDVAILRKAQGIRPTPAFQFI